MKFFLKYKFKIIFLSLLLILIGFLLRFSREVQVVESHPIEAWTTETRADCAVILTGGPHRVREGFDLLSQNQVYKIIISGVHSGAQIHELLPMRATYGQIRDQDVFLERQSQTTYGNAIQSLLIAEVLRCRDVLLVTSNLHMYRAMMTFKSIYPPEIRLISHAVPAGTTPVSRFEIYVEALKSLFYSLWAYTPLS